MNPREVAYWEAQAQGKNGLRHNVVKQCEILSRLLQYQPFGKSVLEIGCGQAITAAAVNLMCTGRFDYTGTELAPAYVDLVSRRWKLPCVQADVLALPDVKVDQVWLFDVMEHVRPADRVVAAQGIAERLKDDGLVLINTPLGDDGHDDEFEHGFEERDLHRFCEDGGFRLAKWERYALEYTHTTLHFAWVELMR